MGLALWFIGWPAQEPWDRPTLDDPDPLCRDRFHPMRRWPRVGTVGHVCRDLPGRVCSLCFAQSCGPVPFCTISIYFSKAPAFLRHVLTCPYRKVIVQLKKKKRERERAVADWWYTRGRTVIHFVNVAENSLMLYVYVIVLIFKKIYLFLWPVVIIYHPWKLLRLELETTQRVGLGLANADLGMGEKAEGRAFFSPFFSV